MLSLYPVQHVLIFLALKKVLIALHAVILPGDEPNMGSLTGLGKEGTFGNPGLTLYSSTDQHRGIKHAWEDQKGKISALKRRVPQLFFNQAHFQAHF